MGDDFPSVPIFRIYLVRQWIHARVSHGCCLDEFHGLVVDDPEIMQRKVPAFLRSTGVQTLQKNRRVSTVSRLWKSMCSCSDVR